MSDEQVEKLQKLRRIKRELLMQACDLRNKLRQQENTGILQSPTLNFKLPNNEPQRNTSGNELSDKYTKKLLDASKAITGLSFTDVDRNWLRDNVYRYTANVITKAINFQLELTIKLQNDDNFEVHEMKCHFTGIENCYLKEIIPWVECFVKSNNFSYLMSAVTDYSDYSIIRTKILHELEAEHYVTVKEYNKEEGGLLIRVHSPKATQKVLLDFQWSLQFLDSIWKIEHHFIINPTELGTEFTEQHQSLLKEFCKISLSKDDLKKLWLQLCTAIDEYDNI